jgi:hypothetical protein
MNLDLSLASIIFSSVICIGGFLYFRVRESAWKARHDELAARFDLLVVEESRHRRQMADLLGQRDVNFENEVRQIQTDMKMLDLQMKAGPSREAPESVELAIQLTRAGESREVVASRTGLPSDIVDFITTMHAARPKA